LRVQVIRNKTHQRQIKRICLVIRQTFPNHTNAIIIDVQFETDFFYQAIENKIGQHVHQGSPGWVNVKLQTPIPGL
jgi:hypothetical protein